MGKLKKAGYAPSKKSQTRSKTELQKLKNAGNKAHSEINF